MDIAMSDAGASLDPSARSPMILTLIIWNSEAIRRSSCRRATRFIPSLSERDGVFANLCYMDDVCGPDLAKGNTRRNGEEVTRGT